MTKYKTTSCRWDVKAEITPVEVERESDAFIWIGGRRRNKVNDYVVYHDSWDEAYAFLLRKATEKVERAREALVTFEHAKVALDNLRSMRRTE
jgi:hypothetical protein